MGFFDKFRGLVTPEDPRAYDYPAQSLPGGVVPYSERYDRADQDRPQEYEALEGRIRALARSLGRNPDEMGSGLQRSEQNTDDDLYARTKLNSALERSYEKRRGHSAPGASRDRYSELTGESGPMRETAVPGKSAWGGEFRLDYEPRVPSGTVASKREVTAPAEGAKAATKAPSNEWDIARSTPEGFLSQEERKFISDRIRRDMLSGDQRNEKDRRRYLIGTGWGKAWTGASDTPSGRRAYGNIVQNEKSALAEFDRPEELRQERLRSNMGALGADMGYADSFDKFQRRTVSHNGNVVDPDVAARHPELYVDADLNALRKAGVDDETLGTIASMQARKFGQGLQTQSLEAEKTRAEIAKLNAEAARANAEAEKKAADPDDLAIRKEKIWREYQSRVETLAQAEEDKWFTFNRPEPTDREFLMKLQSRGELPLGYDLNQSNMASGYRNEPVLEAEAKQQEKREREAAIRALLQKTP